VDINPDVRQETEGSTAWRMEMFHMVWEEAPDYFWIGKGYAVDPTELYLTSEAMRMGLGPDYEEAMVAGDYHNGMLSVIIPFGIFGLIGMIWFLSGWGEGPLQQLPLRGSQVGAHQLSPVLLFSGDGRFLFLVFGALNSQLMVLRAFWA